MFVITAHDLRGKPLQAYRRRKKAMTESRFPEGWDAERVKRVIDYYEALTEDEEVADDEAATTEQDGQVVITVPEELLPAIRRLLAHHKSA